jgi:hypothetical protein
MIPKSATQLSSTHGLDAELDRRRLARRLREKTVLIAWMRQYVSEPREASVAARYVRQAIADFEAEVEAMNREQLST